MDKQTNAQPTSFAIEHNSEFLIFKLPTYQITHLPNSLPGLLWLIRKSQAFFSGNLGVRGWIARRQRSAIVFHCPITILLYIKDSAKINMAPGQRSWIMRVLNGLAKITLCSLHIARERRRARQNKKRAAGVFIRF